MTFLLRYWPYLAILAFGALLGSGATHLVEQHRYDALQADFHKYKLNAALELNRSITDAQARLSAQADKIQEIERAAQEKTVANDRLLADMRAKYGRLRIATRCPSAVAMPPANDSSEHIGTGAGVVPRPDDGVAGEDLIAFAQDAERVRGQLMACQAVVRSIQ